jgi:hypothetical protein
MGEKPEDVGQKPSVSEQKSSDAVKLRGRYKGKVRLVNRSHLDGRTTARFRA